MQNRRHSLLVTILLSFLVSAELCLIADSAAVLCGFHTPYVLFFSVLFIAASIVFLLARKNILRPFRAALALLGLSALLSAVVFAAHGIFRSLARYEDTGNDRTFSDLSVLVIVPHEDDDICIAGGLIEKFISEGCELRVAFTTNGDYKGRDMGLRRIDEAVSALALCGVSEDNIIFLGYPDGFADASANMYFAAEDEKLSSHAGLTSTYGSDTHPPYSFSEYTRRNFKADLSSLILGYRPDMIFCTDMDYHEDHKLLSLLFDETMGELLRDTPDYTPLVFKGFAYSTAYYGAEDFYGENLPSTINIFGGDYTKERTGYKWQERVRFPVLASTLSRSLFDCTEYRALCEYESQLAEKHAQAIINGDRVFWQRCTDSLSYRADFTASSGDVSCLNDFKLYDLTGFSADGEYYSGFWIPDDSSDSFTVSFDEPADIEYICLYDNPSADSNVLDAVIRLDSGETIHTGALEKLGGKSVILLNAADVNSFTLQLTETEGTAAGIGECEVFSGDTDDTLSFIKLMNDSGDFVYDYYISPEGEEDFSLYSYGCPCALEDCTVSCEGNNCTACISGDKLRVVCPEGESCTVTVSYGNNTDCVRLSNPSALLRNGYRLDRFIYENRFFYIELAPYRLLKDIYHAFVPLTE